MPPEDRRGENESEEEEHKKVDRRASRDADAEPAQGEAAEEAPAEEGQEPGPAEGTDAEGATAATAGEQEGAPEADEEEPPSQITVYGLLRMSIGMYAQQAWIHMGVRMDPSTQKTEQNMSLAKVAVDTVAFVVEQLQPDLNPEEKRELDSLVADLRINYVQRS